MSHERRAQLVELGLSPTEAQVYLALLAHNGSMGAAAVASATGLSRTSVYQILCALADKGLVATGLGYGSKFRVVAPDQALPSLVVRERETLSQRERLADVLGKQLASLVTPAESAPDEPIQVIRNPQVFTDRFERLQLEAERQVDMLMKAPIINPRKDNPTQAKAQRRGIRFRGLYEAAVLEDPEIAPYVETWVAGGEEARVYNGELPYKLAVFDREVVLLTLKMPGDQLQALFIRHEQLAKSLSMLFEFLWERGEPLALKGPRKRSRTSKSEQNENHNGKRTRAGLNSENGPVKSRPRAAAEKNSP
jgi:sugar-specific transcriptional regulator TrmB